MEREERWPEPERCAQLARGTVARDELVDDREPGRVAERSVDLGTSFDLHADHRTDGDQIVQCFLNEVCTTFSQMST